MASPAAGRSFTRSGSSPPPTASEPYAGTVNFTRTDATTGAVFSGSQRFNELGASRGMFKHPQYEADSGFGQPRNDIALIRLAQPFAIGDGIQTAALPRF